MPRHQTNEEHGQGGRSQRQLRVGEELRHALAQLLRPGELHDPALFDANVTVTEVRLSPDLRSATAFVMPLGGANAADIITGLKRSAPYLKSQIARLVRLRHVPNLGFELDGAFDAADRISTLLHSEPVERDLRTEDEDPREQAEDEATE
ncbi:MAG TPA: 30S ribosome-binding factor RbfA [Stellaceae bacterium]|jgi:ribosome-binding factor A|nr:30S ribosome-binding factor RbfA [Stellaceae bacterium]